MIVPIFALANAGVHLNGGLLGDAVSSPITLGIVFGYVVGKPLGILGAAWLVSRTWLFGSPPGSELAGDRRVARPSRAIGFTVSVLIASIALDGRQLEEAKLGVLAAATRRAACLAWIAFQVIKRMPAEVRARQIAGTYDDLLDLSEDVDPERDHIRGPEDAPVTLVEYGDYECPYCGRAEPVVRELLDTFGDDLRYVWRHLPLNDVHPNAQNAAEAAEAAAAQGAFWEMHDKLIHNQDQLGAPEPERHAAELGLDVERFRDEMQRRVVRPTSRRGRVERRREWGGRHARILHQRSPSPGRLRRRDPDQPGQGRQEPCPGGPGSLRGRPSASRSANADGTLSSVD